MDKIKWAIVGTGYIANEFACGLMEVEDGALSACVSRNEDTAREFAAKYGCNDCYTDYNEMLEKADVDIVYLGIPNNCHYEYIMAALEAGKHVLSEKPMADNAWQLEKILAKAEEKDLFVMEGMWTRCFPAVKKTREWIADGAIGEPLTVNAAFDIRTDAQDWQPWKGTVKAAGGAMRDVGIYSIAMAYIVFPEGPLNTYSVHHSNGEVDDSFRMLCDYGDGKAAMLGGAFNQKARNEVEILGTKGRITIGPEFWHPTTATLILNDGTVEKQEIQYKATGFEYEIAAVQKALREGKKECEEFTHEESVKIGALIEAVRKEWGIRYDSDR